MGIFTKEDIDKMIKLGVKDDWGDYPELLLDTEYKGLSMKSAGEEVIVYYFKFFDYLIDWLHEKDCEDIRVPLIEPFYCCYSELSIVDTIHDLTRYFTLRITCKDTLDLIAICGRDIIITPDSNVWISGCEIEEVESMDESWIFPILIAPLIDPEVLKGELGRVNKALEHINLVGEEFELTTGWFENYILSKNPKMADKLQIIRAFDRRILQNSEKFEQAFGVDFNDFQKDYKEHRQLMREL